MKEIKVILENGNKDKDGDLLFVAYAELFPTETRIEDYSHSRTKIGFEDQNTDFIFKQLAKFPDYVWQDYETIPPEEEHCDMFRVTYIEAGDLKEDYC